MFFVGTFDLTVDAKNRLSLPQVLRSKMNYEEDGRAFYVVPGFRKGTLAVYPDRYFERMRDEVPPPERLSDATHEWRQLEYSHSALVDPDTQGRILIPERLLKWAGIGRDVTLIGVQDRLELWDRAAFDAFEKEKSPEYPKHRAQAMREFREQQAGNATAASPA